MEKTATCSCGQLSIQISGKPDIIATCSCHACQVRTGSVFAVNSYFSDDYIVDIKGESIEFTHYSDEGRKIVRSFCPHCGTTVHWKAEMLPTHVGIPVGAFADPEFPEPKVAVWLEGKHKWVNFPEHWMKAHRQDINDPGPPEVPEIKERRCG